MDKLHICRNCKYWNRWHSLLEKPPGMVYCDKIMVLRADTTKSLDTHAFDVCIHFEEKGE